MKGILTKEQLNYVLYHFLLAYKENENIINSKFRYERTIEHQFNSSGNVVFILSNESFNLDKHFYVNDTPVFFPVRKNRELFSIEAGNLVFNYDILKSAFYLLSGQQEIDSSDKDAYGRFPFKSSIQFKMNFVKKPVVNYYFRFIADAINAFLGKDVFVERKLFNTYGLILTHDVDNIKYYTFNNFLYKIKELFGLSNTLLNKSDIIRYLFNYLTFSKENPYWCFDKLIFLEKEFNFKSCFYFLKKEGKNNSIYNFTDSIIKKAFDLIKQENCEIGLHGTVSSAINSYKLLVQKNELEQSCSLTIFGGRQHRLMYNVPQTAINHEYAGIRYDSTLGFAEHVGFRNSFCLPFKPFDFNNNRIIDVWQFPLTVMDVTLFYYQNLKRNDAAEEIISLITEIKKFSGLFTFLWHNGFETAYPKGYLEGFYQDILILFKQNKPQNILGKDLVSFLDKLLN